MIENLTPFRDGLFPRGTLREIAGRREETTDALLDALHEVAADPDAERWKDSFLPIHPAYLLAQFRETRACRPLIELLALPDSKSSDLFGDLITDSMGQRNRHPQTCAVPPGRFHGCLSLLFIEEVGGGGS